MVVSKSKAAAWLKKKFKRLTTKLSAAKVCL